MENTNKIWKVGKGKPSAHLLREWLLENSEEYNYGEDVAGLTYKDLLIEYRRIK